MGAVIQEKLVLDNTALVPYIVKQYYVKGCYEWDELQSVGILGLVKAANTYEPEKGFQFSTFATSCIKNEIFQYFRKNGKYLSVESLDKRIVNEDGDERVLLELIPDKERRYEDVETQMFLDDVLKEAKYRDLICEKYGIGCEPMTQEGLAEKYSLSQSYISRLIKSDLGRMRDFAMRKAPRRQAKGAQVNN